MTALGISMDVEAVDRCLDGVFVGTIVFMIVRFVSVMAPVWVRPERPLGPGLGLTCNEARSVRHALSEWVANCADASPAWTREYQDMALRCVILEYNIDDLCFHLMSPGPWGASFPGFNSAEGAVARFLEGLEQALRYAALDPIRARDKHQ